MQVRLGDHVWTCGAPLGSGGFGTVFEAVDEQGRLAALKLVPKQPGAERELLLQQVSAAHLMPLWDSGETDDHLVLVMPRAVESLRDLLGREASGLAPAQAATILADLALGLSELEAAGIVHRDIKPENALLLGDHWVWSDFGIARYVEASTGPSTRKRFASWEYASPERWRGERASVKSDVYSFGVLAFEIMTGHLPFVASSMDELMELHQRAIVPDVVADSRWSALIQQCLAKVPQARPTPDRIVERLARISSAPTAAAGLNLLAEANAAEVRRRETQAQERDRVDIAAEDHRQLASEAGRQFSTLAAQMLERILDEAPAATQNPSSLYQIEWQLMLGKATFTLYRPELVAYGVWDVPARPFTVAADASIVVTMSEPVRGWSGRSHSLWFGDVQSEGDFAWHETAFMSSPFRPEPRTVVPFAMHPDGDTRRYLLGGVNERQVAFPFTRLELDTLDQFMDRWAGWLAQASQGELQMPSQLPESPTEGSWRRV